MMSEIEYQKAIYKILNSSETPIIKIDYLEVDFLPEIKSRAEELEIETEETQGRLRLFTKSIRTKIFDSIDSFLLAKEIKHYSNILICSEDKPISYIAGIAYESFVESQNYLVKNQIAYLDFLELLKKNETEADDAFQFVDSYNRDSRKISFLGLADKGRLNITYDLKAPLFDSNKDLSINFEKFKFCFSDENKSLLKFLKSAVITLGSNFPKEQRIKLLFESLDEVVDKARINFEVYLNNLSIDKIRKDYDEFKTKYFTTLSDILSKLSHNIIALPIGISATLFAVDKIKDSNIFLIFLLVSIVITTFFMSLFLKAHFIDLMYVSKIFKYDYKTLLDNNFFIKYPNEKSFFEEIEKRVFDRISFLTVIIKSYYWILNISNLVIAYIIIDMLKVIKMDLKYLVIAVLLSLVIIAAFGSYIFKGREKK